LVGYIPALFYANMFTLYYLEVKERTKAGKKKSESDKKIGTQVILIIAMFYAMLYLPLLVTIIITWI